MDNKRKQLKIIISSFDVPPLEETVKELVQKLVQIKADFVQPIPLPTKRILISLQRSPIRYKGSQEQFERLTHRRVIFIREPNKETIINLNSLKLPGMVGMRWISKEV